MSDHTLGFVGTGAMGAPMAMRLIGAGHPLAVHTRTRSRAAALEQAGARWVDSADDLATSCDVVLTCLLDSTAVESVYLGPGGLLESARPGQIFIEHGTFSPELARRLDSAARARDAAFLDVPVTGGPEGARRGTLTAMAGGDGAELDEARAVLSAYCSSVTHVGAPGAGVELKLVNQLLVSVHMAVAGEAVALLEHLGIDLGLARSVLTAGWAGSTMLDRSLSQVIEGTLSGTGATIGGMLEVQALVESLLGDAPHSAPVFDASRLAFAEAVRAGAGELDPAGLARLRS